MVARTLGPMLRTVAATRYVTPFREGGSLPGLCEADDDGLYVVKFHGAGQGPKALVAEVIVGELARAIDLPVPEQVLVELDERFAAGEPHWEVKELLDRSPGTNLGVDFLPGALGFSPVVGPPPDAATGRRLRLAGCVHAQRRPDGAQPQPARLAQAAVRHRPRRRPGRPAPLGGPRPRSRARAAALRAEFATTSCFRSPAPSRRLTRAWPRSSRRTGSPTSWRSSPTPGWPEGRASRALAEHRRAYVDYLRERLTAPHAFVEEAERARTAA